MSDKCGTWECSRDDSYKTVNWANLRYVFPRCNAEGLKRIFENKNCFWVSVGLWTVPTPSHRKKSKWNNLCDLAQEAKTENEPKYNLIIYTYILTHSMSRSRVNNTASNNRNFKTKNPCKSMLRQEDFLGFFFFEVLRATRSRGNICLITFEQI